MMTKAIRIHAYGGPDKLVYEDVEVGQPGPGQVLLRQAAMGINFIDTYHRSGAYPVAALPAVLGQEAAGVVEAVGEGVTGLRPGDRVAYGSGAPGAYAERRLAPASAMIPLPAGIADEIAAASMLQGMTARYLLKQTFAVQPGQHVLVHAAAGGMGLWLCQWARHLGATVIGTTSSPEKMQLAAEHGCHHPINYTTEDFVARVKEITGGAGVPVVYDGVGKDTFLRSLECLAIRGHLVLFGAASGQPDPVPPAILTGKSASLTRPTLAHYTPTRDDLLANAADVFAVLAAGAVRVRQPLRYPLAEAAQAHRDLEARKTTGSLILVP
jgi:NADPH2:quinone reductase